MRFLFATIQSFESDFYGRVGERLAVRGHEVDHVTYSRRSARRLVERGSRARSVRALLEPGQVSSTGYERVLERLFEDVHPDVLFSEPGAELLRSVAHRVARERGVPTLWPSYTIFP